MFFASDNAGPVHPKVMERVIAANSDYAMPYGKDPIMDEVRAQIREQFEAPEAEVYLVATGTAANALALACYTQPWQTIFCSKVAHIEEDECNAPEFYAGAAKLTLVETEDKMTPDALRRAIVARAAGDVHTPQRGPVSITQVTERGGVHSLEELHALTAVAKEYDLPVHMDGARFANAVVALGCTPAEMTWRSGVDVVSFGGTKNGCMGVEAVVFLTPKKHGNSSCAASAGRICFPNTVFCRRRWRATLRMGLGWKRPRRPTPMRRIWPKGCAKRGRNSYMSLRQT